MCFARPKKGALGRSFSRLELWYAKQPHGGKLRIKVDKEEPRVIETASGSLEDAWETIALGEETKKVSVRATGGRVRAYGCGVRK